MQQLKFGFLGKKPKETFQFTLQISACLIMFVFGSNRHTYTSIQININTSVTYQKMLSAKFLPLNKCILAVHQSQKQK